MDECVHEGAVGSTAVYVRGEGSCLMSTYLDQVEGIANDQTSTQFRLPRHHSQTSITNLNHLDYP